VNTEIKAIKTLYTHNICRVARAAE